MKIFSNEKSTRFYPSAFPFFNELVATAAIVVTATATVETVAEKKDYNEDDNPRIAIIVIATAAHSVTPFRLSKPYYERSKEVLQIFKMQRFDN